MCTTRKQNLGGRIKFSRLNVLFVVMFSMAWYSRGT